jgi:hypothetical protein
MITKGHAMNKYGTTNPVLIEARINHDPYDEFAWVQEWRFAIAEYLHHVQGVNVSEFRSGYAEGDFSSLRTESYAFDTLWAQGEIVTSDLEYALKILDRYRNWLHIAGKDY